MQSCAPHPIPGSGLRFAGALEESDLPHRILRGRSENKERAPLRVALRNGAERFLAAFSNAASATHRSHLNASQARAAAPECNDIAHTRATEKPCGALRRVALATTQRLSIRRSDAPHRPRRRRRRRHARESAGHAAGGLKDCLIRGPVVDIWAQDQHDLPDCPSFGTHPTYGVATALVLPLPTHRPIQSEWPRQRVSASSRLYSTRYL